MNLSDLLVVRAIAPYTTCRRIDGRLLVATQCLYPGGDSVAVTVSAGEVGYLVSDDGAAWRELLGAGVEPLPSHARLAKAVAQLAGVEFRHGNFVADEVSEPQLGAAIVTVANAAQNWVTKILSEQQGRLEHALRTRVSDTLDKLFAKHRVVRGSRVSGATGKTYELANVVELRKQRLIVEPVVNYPEALAAAFLKLVDIHNAHPDYAREVVIEDETEWTSADLSVLSQASDGVRDITRGLEPLREKYSAAA